MCIYIYIGGVNKKNHRTKWKSLTGKSSTTMLWMFLEPGSGLPGHGSVPCITERYRKINWKKKRNRTWKKQSLDLVGRIWGNMILEYGTEKKIQTICFYCLHALTVSGISSASAGTYNLPVQKQAWIEHVYYILHRKSNKYNYAFKSLGISQILNGTVLLHDTYDVANPRIN